MEFNYKEVSTDKTFAAGDKGEDIAKAWLIDTLTAQNKFKPEDLYIEDAPKEYFPEWDFKLHHKSGLEATYEVKNDVSGHKYGNLYIEVQNGSGKPTGINATRAKWWIHLVPTQEGNKCWVFVFRTDRLRRAIASGRFRIKENTLDGNGWAAGALIPYEGLGNENNRGLAQDIGLTKAGYIDYR